MNINKKLILTGVNVESKDELLNQLVNRTVEAGLVGSFEDYRNSVERREQEISTNMGNGIAIPHGKSVTVLNPFFAFAKLNQAIQWNPKDDSKVDLIFLLGVPDNSAANDHLRLLSKLAGHLVNDDFVESLRKITSLEEALSIFEKLNFEENYEN